MNWREPDVFLAFADILLESVARGARVVRLDAFGYVWKEEGTSCIDRPANHDIIRALKALLASAGAESVALLPSVTNVTQADAFAYFAGAGQQAKADLVYHLPLSGLLLHSLYAHDASALRAWLAELPPAPRGCAYLNLAASHDGIGLTWLRGLLPEDAIARLIEGAVARGALLSKRKRTIDDDELAWEINSTYFSACAPDGTEDGMHVERFLATQSVVLALRGVPALYLSLFVAGENDHERVARTGDNRAINRGRFDVDAPVLTKLVDLLRVRGEHPAFHPEGAQRVVDVGNDGVLAFVRTAPDERSRVLCLASFSASNVTIGAEALGGAARDLVSGRDVDGRAALTLAPYAVAWLAS